MDDDGFAAYLHQELVVADSPLVRQGYGPLLARAERVVLEIRRKLVARGEHATWKRLMKKGRLVKELNETLPVIARVLAWINGAEGAAAVAAAEGGKLTIVDLCSGVGYMSLVLAELLAGSPRVARFVLVDNAFPNYGSTAKPSNINPTHLYLGNDMWSFELTHRRYNLKKSSGLRQLNDHVVARAEGGVVMLAVHLCGTLALRAVQFFNDRPRCAFFALKPCCLPPLTLAKQKFVWRFPQSRGGSSSTSSSELSPESSASIIRAVEVCASGSYNKGKWRGSAPRHHQEAKFGVWATRLFAAIDVGAASDGGGKDVEERDLLPPPAADASADKSREEAKAAAGAGAPIAGKRKRAITSFELSSVTHYQTTFLYARRRYSSAAGTLRDIGGNPVGVKSTATAALPKRRRADLPPPAAETAAAAVKRPECEQV